MHHGDVGIGQVRAGVEHQPGHAGDELPRVDNRPQPAAEPRQHRLRSADHAERHGAERPQRLPAALLQLCVHGVRAAGGADRDAAVRQHRLRVRRSAVWLHHDPVAERRHQHTADHDADHEANGDRADLRVQLRPELQPRALLWLHGHGVLHQAVSDQAGQQRPALRNDAQRAV